MATRLDAFYWQPKFRVLDGALSIHADWVKRLESIATGLTNGDHGGIKYTNDGVRYLRGQAVTEFGLELNKDELYISEEEHSRMIRAEVLPGDVLYTIAGSTGNACVVSGLDRANINQAIVRVRPGHSVVPQYLADFLNSALGRLQGERKANGGVQLNINFSEVKSLQILVPPIDVQRRLVAELDAARAERDRALAEAERLLGSIDKYVLAELAILPEADNRRVFAVRRAQVQPRLDADYHSPYFQRLRRAIEQSKHASRTLGELAVFMRSGFAAGRQDQAQGDEAAVPHLRPLNLNAWGELSIAETKSVPASRVKEGDYLEQGEVLFNNTNSAEWVGKSTVFNLEMPCVCSNHMTRISLKPGVEPHFVAALLNAFRGIGYFSALSTFFNNQAGINTTTLAKLRVPVPDFATQQAIAAEVVNRNSEARRLQDHAETVWREARQRFEHQLLQGATP